MKNKTLYLIIALLVVAQFYSISKLSSIENKLSNLEHSINNVDNRVRNSISSIYANIDEKLNEQASIIHRAKITFGNLNKDMISAPITFTVQPKQVSENTAVFLQFKDEKIQLEKKDTLYSVTKDFLLSETDIFPTIIIEENGIERITEDLALRIYSVFHHFIPQINAQSQTSVTVSQNVYKRSGTIVIDGQIGELVSAKFITKADDKIIDEKEIDLDQMQVDPFLEINDEYKLEKGQTLISYVVAIDKLGYTHKTLTHHYVIGSNSQREPYFKDYVISAPDGTVVYDTATDEKYIEEMEAAGYGFKTID